MSHPYSKRFVSATASTGSTPATVPPGKVWIVQCVTGVTARQSYDQVATGVIDGKAAFCEFWAAGNVAIPIAGFCWNGKCVLFAGETLRLTANGGTWDLTASGYELDA